MPRPTLLITGAAGFIGSHLVRQLLVETDYCLVGYDKLTYAGRRENLADLTDDDRFTLVEADICDHAAIRATLADYQPVGLLHLAAESHVDRSIAGPDAFIQTNVVGTHVLLDAARAYYDQLDPAAARQFRFLHVSTDEVYGSLAPDALPFCEKTAYDPRSPYAASKAASDHLVRAWGQTYGLPVLVTNSSNNYGPYQFPEKLIPVVILKAIHGQPIPIYGQGENIRDWLYVEDHARALIDVFRLGRVGATYCIGGNNELRNLDLVGQLCMILDELHPPKNNQRLAPRVQATSTSYSTQIEFVEDRPGHDVRYAMNATKIRRELGWRPVEQADTGFRKTVAWYLENEHWWKTLITAS